MTIKIGKWRITIIIYKIKWEKYPIDIQDIKIEQQLNYDKWEQH